MAHQPVGAGFSFATNQTSASQTFTVQSDTLRVVAKNAGQHVAIGTTGPATTTDYYVPANSSATLNLGRVSSIGIAGITKGAATVITHPEGMGNPFKVNDVIVISGVTGVTGFNTTAKIVSIQEARARGFAQFGAELTIDHDSRVLNSDIAVVTAAAARRQLTVSAVTDHTTAGQLFAKATARVDALKPAVANTMLGYELESEEDVEPEAETVGELDNDEETEEEE